MRSLRRSASPYDTFVDTLRPFLARRLTELGGLVLFTGAIALTVALATWSIDDPSLNHATDHVAHNVLGQPGAVVSDLAMQILGLGALAFVLPPALWGVRLMRERDLPNGGMRIALWIIGFCAASAVASALPPTARWPLPTGLGGVAGDALMSAARTIVGAISQAGAALVGFVYAGVAILSLTAACRVAPGLDEAEDDVAPAMARADRPRRTHPDAAQDRRYDDRDESDEPGLGIVGFGTVLQAAMRGRAALAERWEMWRAQRAGLGALSYAGASPALAARRAFSDEDLPWASQLPNGGRAGEPVFEPRADQATAPAAPHAAPAPQGRRPLPVVHDDEDFEGEDFRGEDSRSEDEPTPVPAEAAASRVSAPVAPVAPARRPAPASGRDDYRHPALDLLAEPRGPSQASLVSADALEQNATLLEATLGDFGVRGDILAVRPGPVVTLYELEPAPGTKSSRVISLADDIARSMSAVSARVAVVPGRNAIGIELPNARRETVYLRELLASADFVETKHKLALCLGKNIGGEPIIADLARMPHLLVAGTTGSGKSVAINTMILSLLYRMKPEECRLIMVDPKMLELSVYDGIPHLL
ncbi:DNA translocase FtsK 4TM domain-containing protein, partial [Methylobacterium sp. E-025]|uniref:DNA translocase FtsK n=1 Tax=Methylobacterium sp. E-025 TaxID=2836561 RepID=UPI001FBB3AE5